MRYWSLKGIGLNFQIIQLLWNLTGISAPVLLRHLSNFRMTPNLKLVLQNTARHDGAKIYFCVFHLVNSNSDPETHFTNDLCVHNPNLLKIHVIILWKIMAQSGHNFALQNCDLICSSEWIFEQKNFNKIGIKSLWMVSDMGPLWPLYYIHHAGKDRLQLSIMFNCDTHRRLKGHDLLLHTVVMFWINVAARHLITVTQDLIL